MGDRASQLQLRDSEEILIDPATEDKQDDIITELQSLVNQGVSTDLEGLGLQSVGTTAVEVDFTGTTESIRISYPVTASGILYVGKSDVTNLGANAIDFLLPGEGLTIDYEDGSNAVYVVSDTTAQQFMAGALK